MAINSQDEVARETLHHRLRTILPEQYQDRDDEVQPVSMGSAGLRFDSEGRVAWNEIWGTFCDLAMAGGPPHRGRLLEPGLPAEIEANALLYQQAYAEIHRGITLVTGLPIEPSPSPGWIRIHCAHSGMAGWLVRAINMENVSARTFGPMLDLPVGPHYRLEKEIKNVITVIAKTCHYWTGHIPPLQQRKIANLFARMGVESPLLQPCPVDVPLPPALYAQAGEAIHLQTGLKIEAPQYHGWLGISAATFREAIWLMRAMATKNILSRREETTLYLPLDPERDTQGAYLIESIAQIRRCSVLLPS